MDNLITHSKDFTDENTENLVRLFPGCITESSDVLMPAQCLLSDTLSGKCEVLLAANAPAACFEKTFGITEDFCKELAGHEPLRVVFRDFGFKDDSAKINEEQIFKLMSPHTEVKSI